MDPFSCARLRYTKSFIVIFFLIINTALSDILPSILWSTDNPFYKNIGDQARTVFPKDKITFICSNTAQNLIKRTAPLDKDILYANIYRVNKQGYDSCNSSGGLKILICNDPTELKSKTIQINEDAAVPGIPVFKYGQTYYFIDTSSGTENTINNHIGGRCKTHNMKMKMYVCNDTSDPKCPHGNQVVNGGWSSWQECNSGNQNRQCNNPSPANGGYLCEGKSSQSCTSIKPTQPTNNNNNNTSGNTNNSYTFTPMKGKRTSVADTLGTLSVGAVVVIFLAIFIVGCVLGLVVGVLGTHKKLKQFVVKRRPARSNNNANRDSYASTAHFRPTSFASILSTSTGITNFDAPVENDNFTKAAESGVI